ncbi:MAG: hypothetical protein QM765_31005 [Myxococcales bacterium]
MGLFDFFRRTKPPAPPAEKPDEGVEEEEGPEFQVVIQGTAQLLNCDDDSVARDPALLATLDGKGEDADMAQYIWPDKSPELHSLELDGGDLYLRYDPATQSLRTETRYRVGKRLSDEELALVLEYTRGQWSDGVGEDFDPCLRLHNGHATGIGWENPMTARLLDPEGQELAAVTRSLPVKASPA